MKKYSFDEIVPREGTNCLKYDARERFFGKSDVLPLWVADMDFKTPDFIVDAIKKTGTANQVFFFDNDYDALKEVLTMLPEALLMPRAYDYNMADSALNIFKPEVIHIDESFYTPELTSLIRSKNARIWINALGEPDDQIRKGQSDMALQNLLKYGANIIQTDEPELLIPLLEKKRLHN